MEMHAIQPKQASMRSGCMVAKSEEILPPTIPTPCPSSMRTGISVNSTNALPYFDFFGCDCADSKHRPNLVA
jgi:hypothetical protein